MATHLTHWGAFEASSDGDRLTAVRPWRADPEPTPLIANIASAQHHPARIAQPHVRRGWLEHGQGPAARGADEFVPVSWETALELLSGELSRVYGDFGPHAVYGGSYGWASAGRFHHAQSQVHRFLNCLGGYVAHRNSYSLGASTVLLPHILADMGTLMARARPPNRCWPSIRSWWSPSAGCHRRIRPSLRAGCRGTMAAAGSRRPGAMAAGSSP
ncbi:molybdopterin-dependent oxidoreductase [Nocardia yunnanensis]|uniref:molybdopterin-dependent oxidoreductase n=1 Tax=Nocardia yunnanensis TaxID=2382165 RepID=UPI00165721D0|nr:molybdopterin-dependent oxidoreductase [Nocardia yunnanensis]